MTCTISVFHLIVLRYMLLVEIIHKIVLFRWDIKRTFSHFYLILISLLYLGMVLPESSYADCINCLPCPVAGGVAAVLC